LNSQETLRKPVEPEHMQELCRRAYISWTEAHNGRKLISECLSGNEQSDEKNEEAK